MPSDNYQTEREIILRRKEEFFQYLQAKGLYYSHQEPLFQEHLKHPALEKMLLDAYGSQFIGSYQPDNNHTGNTKRECRLQFLQ